MPISLPYLASPGSIKTAFERIRNAATPDRVTRDFVTTKLQIKGGTGAALIPFFKKIGFVASDGSPTDLYIKFRNPSSGGHAVARAVKQGYSALAEVNEYFYELSDKDLLSLIIQVTGAKADDQVAKLTLSTLKTLKGFGDFESAEERPDRQSTVSPMPLPAVPTTPLSASEGRGIGLNLGYTFNLNLPATSDQTVFNAIFRSLKEHLLSNDKE